MQPFFGKLKVKELFLENLAIFSKNMEKINIFGENLLKKYSKIGVLIFQKYSKIEVIYEVKISVHSKSIPKSGFYCSSIKNKLKKRKNRTFCAFSFIVLYSVALKSPRKNSELAMRRYAEDSFRREMGRDASDASSRGNEPICF